MSHPTPEPHRRFHPAVLVAFLVAAIGLTFLFREVRGRQSTPVPDHLKPVAAVPAARFTDQTGAPLAPSDLRGKLWVANFIFTRCAGPCPIMTARMSELNRKLGANNRDVTLVSFSVDPDYDSPSVLKDYAERNNADPKRWKFLTAPKPEMERFVVKGMLQALDKDNENLPVHSTRFVLVDREGMIRGFRDGNDPDVTDQLLMDIGDLLRETPAQQ